MLAGMNEWDKEELYLQGAETYYYLNQVHRTNEITTIPQLSYLGCNVILSSSLAIPYTLDCLFPPPGGCVWTKVEAGQAGLPAASSVLWDHRSACWPDIHRLGHTLLHPAARQHLLQLIRGVCVRVQESEWEVHRSDNDIIHVGAFFFRASRSRWRGSSARPRPGGSAPCCRFPLRPCRPSSLTGSRLVASRTGRRAYGWISTRKPAGVHTD